MIIHLAAVSYKIPKKIGNFCTLVKILIWILQVVGVVAYYNLSTAIIIFRIAICMLFVASPKISHFVILGVPVLAFGGVFIALEGYRMDRIKICRNP